jgi:hypothetical protein
MARTPWLSMAPGSGEAGRITASAALETCAPMALGASPRAAARPAALRLRLRLRWCYRAVPPAAEMIFHGGGGTVLA